MLDFATTKLAFGETVLADEVDYLKAICLLTDEVEFPSLGSPRKSSTSTSTNKVRSQKHGYEPTWEFLGNSKTDDVKSVDSVQLWSESFSEVVERSVNHATDHSVPEPTSYFQTTPARPKRTKSELQQCRDTEEEEDIMDDTDMFFHRKASGPASNVMNKYRAKQKAYWAQQMIIKEYKRESRQQVKAEANAALTGCLAEEHPSQEALRLLERRHPRDFTLKPSEFISVRRTLYSSMWCPGDKEYFYTCLWYAMHKGQERYVDFLLSPEVPKAFRELYSYNHYFPTTSSSVWIVDLLNLMFGATVRGWSSRKLLDGGHYRRDAVPHGKARTHFIKYYEESK
ncbi:hypothetical protein BCR43DRAFT_493100 [Syncephalastrum racemosum]|uniref:Uncharacterized protein n=1 Tax=Syncephalastrum racemosum TaxID=13706 RepID=A0A1X2H9Z7_SYNRA|nr:hypothetical protein BCR43DRAFT_493100 [Syncephalastrum racemosum]